MDEEFEFNEQAAPQDEGFEALADPQDQEQEDQFEAEPQPEPEASPVPSPVAYEPATTMPRRMSSDAHVTIPAASEATNKWKADNEKKIKQRDAEFTKTKQEMLKKAEQTLEKIRSERAQLIAKNAKANREAQAKAQAASASKAAPDAPVAWKKMAQLVDLEKETTDRERMRSLFKTKVAEAKS